MYMFPSAYFLAEFMSQNWRYGHYEYCKVSGRLFANLVPGGMHSSHRFLLRFTTSLHPSLSTIVNRLQRDVTN